MMNRNILKCDACSEEITVRIAIGMGEKQVYIFACPSCQIEIGITLDADAAAGTWSYRDPSNAQWLRNAEPKKTRFTITFDSENLIARGTGDFPDVIPAFPFAMNVYNPPDPEAAMREDATRKQAYATIWPRVRRLRVHFDNRAADLFDSEMKAIVIGGTKPYPPQTWQTRTDAFCSLTEHFISQYLLAEAQKRELANRIIWEARGKHPTETTTFAKSVVASGQANRLWLQLWEVREMYMKMFPALNPLLKFAGWRPGYSVKDYYLSEKQFVELRPLYVNSFETLSKLSALAIAFEQLGKAQPLEIPTRKGSLTLQEYDGLANGSKPDHLAKFEIGQLFVPYMDNHLRNGIGHNSAHYLAGKDVVQYRSSRGDKVVEDSIAYTEFCQKVLENVSATEVAAIFLARLMSY